MEESINLKKLKKDFEFKYQKSPEKEALLKRETECFEYIFNYDVVPIYGRNIKVITERSFSIKFPEYSEYFEDNEVLDMKRAYDYFIVQAADNDKAWKWYQDNIPCLGLRFEELQVKAISFVNTVKVYYEYFRWLKNYSKPISKYSDKFYSWYHKIRIAIGKADSFTPGAKKEVIDYGKNNYKTKGSGFYQAFMDFNLSERQKFVKSLSLKDRKNWKRIIIEISNNDSDVISFLNDFPN